MQQRNVLEYLEKTVARLPDKLAFAGENEELTFGQLYRDSRAIGSFLYGKGFYREPVLVFMKKQPRTVAAFFGCVYGGDCYVPVDDEMPLFRLELIMKTLQPRAVICEEGTRDAAVRLAENAEGDSPAVFLYDEMLQGEDAAALDKIRAGQIDTDPVYIVFTSGSTGIPKGVAACHRSVIDYIENLSAALDFGEDTVFANQTPLYFDDCLKELYPTLKFGATTYFVPKSLFMFPIRLVEFLNEHRINTICWVVSALTMISSFGTFDKVVPQYLKTVAFGSEVFPVKQFNLWRKVLPEAEFFNLYGPTEATGMSCVFKVDRDFEPGDAIPIGRPFPNTEILLLTDKNELAGPGETGEICIRGTALTLGYYRDFERTREVFVQNPLNDRYPELIYRTGDLARYNEYGELVFVSRRDYQIKHMGHRIELGEIEAVVNTVEGITACACLYDQERGKILLFYTGAPEARVLMGSLKEKLARYMLPNKVEKLEKMPLTANGKLDRTALKKYYQEKDGRP